MSAHSTHESVSASVQFKWWATWLFLYSHGWLTKMT